MPGFLWDGFNFFFFQFSYLFDERKIACPAALDMSCFSFFFQFYYLFYVIKFGFQEALDDKPCENSNEDNVKTRRILKERRLER